MLLRLGLRKGASGRPALVSLVSALALLSTACQGGGSQADSNELSIAYQHGLNYAPLLIMKNQGWLEEEISMDVSWRQLASGSAIRDGMISGDINVGSGGIGPFLIGRDAGVDWKLLGALGNVDYWLMAMDESITSVSNLKPDNKIAMPAPDSIQAVILEEDAKKELGDSSALDRSIVSMPHPDALQALLTGQVDAYFASPPFQYQAQDEGAHKILGSYDVMGGPHTANSVFVMPDFYQEHSAEFDEFYELLERANTLLTNNPEKAAKIIAEEVGDESLEADYAKWLTDKSVTFTTVPQGFERFIEAMTDIGVLESPPKSWRDVVLPTLDDVKGS